MSTVDELRQRSAEVPFEQLEPAVKAGQRAVTALRGRATDLAAIGIAGLH
jgi:hypothetical protein